MRKIQMLHIRNKYPEIKQRVIIALKVSGIFKEDAESYDGAGKLRKKL